MQHPSELLALLRGRVAEVLASRHALPGGTAERLAADLATAFLVVGAERTRAGSDDALRAVETADRRLLDDVPGAVADPRADDEEDVAAFLGPRREHVLRLVAARAGVSAAAAGAAAASVAPVVAAWLARGDDDPAAALAAAGTTLADGTGWLVAGGALDAAAGTSGAGAAAAAGRRRLVAWGALLAALLAGGIVALGVGIRGGDGAGDDVPATVAAAGDEGAAASSGAGSDDGVADGEAGADDASATDGAATDGASTGDETSGGDAVGGGAGAAEGSGEAGPGSASGAAAGDAGAAAGDGATAPAADVAAALEGTGGHALLLEALAASRSAGAAVAADAPVTIFAPGDAALRAVPAATLDDPEALDALLGYHVVRGALGPADLVDGATLTTLSGRRLRVEVEGRRTLVGGALARPLATTASGDVVYTISKVLRPPATINAELGLAPVTFESGSDVITPAGRAVLDRAVRYLTATPVRVLIEGHTDSDGDATANLDLSNRRAAAVKRYLSEHGVRAALLTTRGLGESRPVATNATEAGKARNRRIAFRVLGPG